MTFDQVAALQAPAPDRIVAYGPAPQQFGHLRLPKGPAPFPVIIYVHGGCYRAEYSIAHAAAAEQALADSGYAVWSLEYRRLGDAGGGWPGTFQDLAAGADHLRVLAVTHRLDLTSVVAMGHSAGANSALWLAARRRIPKTSELYAAEPLPVAGVVALAPAGDFAEMHAKDGCGGIMEELMGGLPALVPDRYRAASPGQLLPIGLPYSVVIGELDSSFNEFGRSFAARAKAAGDSGLLVIDAPGAGHFDVIAPVSPTWTIVLRAVREVFAGAARRYRSDSDR